VAGTADEVADDGSLGSLCEHPERTKAATADAAFNVTNRFRCIQSVGRAIRPRLILAAGS
jgi:hypothetical protein